MAVYLELIADDVDDIAEWIGVNLGASNAQVELLADGDCYVSLDLRVKVVNDETGEGHPRPLVEVLAVDDVPAVPDLDSIRREELSNLNLMRATIAGRAGTGDAMAKAQLDAIDRRRAILLDLADLPEPDGDELLPD